MLYNWFLGIYNIVYEKLYLVLVSGIQWFEKIGLILLNFKIENICVSYFFFQFLKLVLLKFYKIYKININKIKKINCNIFNINIFKKYI